MKRDQQILSEITLLEHRIKHLRRLLALRAEANILEAQVMHGTSSKEAVAIITKTVCEKYKVEFQRLVSPGREQSVVVPRQIVFYLARSLINMPFERIGESFGRDHGTVMHACRSIEDRMSTQDDFRQKVTALSKQCRENLAKQNGCVNNSPVTSA